MQKPFDLLVPIETRMHFLMDYRSLQLREIQDLCSHKDFKDGVCLACDLKCDHDDREENYCLICGEELETPEPDIDRDEHWEDL